MNFSIALAPNIRTSPYFEAAKADGMAALSVYNHMFCPAHFGDPKAEYDRLINGVVMWDVAAQRQVEITGPDASALVQYLTTRDVGTATIGQGRYVPICNHAGDLINDPVLLKLADDRFWLSIADSDIELWASAIAAERGMDVDVFEADASPLAVQGPLAEDLIADLFGDWVRSIRYFGFRETSLNGIRLVLARSGWSKQGGFELYLTDGTRGTELWTTVKAAGQKYGIGPGAPNDVERIESGLLSYGADARHTTLPANPFELGLGKLVDFDSPDDFIGRAALQQIKAEGVKRRFTGFVISGDPIQASTLQQPVFCNDTEVGLITEMVHSPRLQKNIGLGLVSNKIEADAHGLRLFAENTSRKVSLTRLPFV